jgi:hypothetical protein
MRCRTNRKAFSSEDFKFTRSFEVEIAARRWDLGSNMVINTEAEQEQMSSIFLLGIEQFPDSAFLHVAYAMYMLDTPESLQLVPIELNRAEALQSSPDVWLMIQQAERIRKVPSGFPGGI